MKEKVKGISVLFVTRTSIYKELVEDCYDIERDARTFPGASPALSRSLPHLIPVIAHPPCRAWGRLRSFANPRPDEKDLARYAISVIRYHGGILEHPAGSLLWSDQSLPLPGKSDQFGGYTVHVNQSWFGHECRKSTWLYIVGLPVKSLPDYPISFDAVQKTVGNSKRKGQTGHRPEISKKAREETPRLFAEWLIEVALKIRNHANN